MAKNGQEKDKSAEAATFVEADVVTETFAPLEDLAANPAEGATPIAEAVRVYRTTRPVVHPFDILCKGVTIQGHWNSMKRQHVRFVVPAALVEWFEKHDHVVTGFVAAEPEAPAE